jgi:O-antigen ligase
MFRSFIYNNVYREAHNDYVQFLAESGIVFLALLLLTVHVLYSRIRHILNRELRRLEIIQIGAFCSLTSLALHSLTDFSLQIPAIALQGAVIAGLFFSHYHAEHRSTR